MGKEATDRFKGLVKDIQPMLIEIPLELEPPTLDDSSSDLDRLNRGLKKTGCCDVDRLSVGIKVMRELATAMREENWNVTVSVMRKKCSNEILNVTAKKNHWDLPSMWAQPLSWFTLLI